MYLLNKVKMIRLLKLQCWLLVILKTRCCITVEFDIEKGIFLQILN